MANKIQKPCRVCGKMFTPCADCANDKTMFRWKKFTCSFNCAKEYFAMIEASRQTKAKTDADNAQNDNTTQTNNVDLSDAINDAVIVNP